MRVLITGAAGRIGREIVSELKQTHELRLLDRVPVPGHESIVADLAKARVRNLLKPWSKSRLPQWMQAFEGVTAVLHLAANANPNASWDNVLQNNIKTTWNVCEAAVKHKVPRVVFASSNYAVKALELERAPACYRPSGPKIAFLAAEVRAGLFNGGPQMALERPTFYVQLRERAQDRMRCRLYLAYRMLAPRTQAWTRRLLHSGRSACHFLNRGNARSQ